MAKGMSKHMIIQILIWKKRILPVASIPLPNGVAIQSINETNIANCKNSQNIMEDHLTIDQEVAEDIPKQAKK